ncbi:MAG: hypothetical protein ACKN81_11310, partial [Pirellulaceae bacterium]
NGCGGAIVGDRREFFFFKPLGPGGPGRHYAAPPGLVLWINRESFTIPASCHLAEILPKQKQSVSPVGCKIVG